MGIAHLKAEETPAGGHLTQMMNISPEIAILAADFWLFFSDEIRENVLLRQVVQDLHDRNFYGEVYELGRINHGLLDDRLNRNPAYKEVLEEAAELQRILVHRGFELGAGDLMIDIHRNLLIQIRDYAVCRG